MNLFTFLSDYTLRTVALGAAVLGAAAGAIGTFAVLRGRSLLGDAVAHAALPGIVLAFVLTGRRETLVLVLGAGAAGWLGTLCVTAITRWSRLPEDAALGIVLSVFFGIGTMLLTWVQRLPTAAQAGLDRFLFGQAATLIGRDVLVISVLAVAALGVLLLIWKEAKVTTFDRDFAHSIGIRVTRVELLLTTLLVAAIVIGLQAVGVVLMSALVVAPASAARQWSHRLGAVVLLAGAFGAVAGMSGAVLSALVPGLPTGPTIVVLVSILVLLSLLFAPERGLIARRLAARARDRRLLSAMAHSREGGEGR